MSKKCTIYNGLRLEPPEKKNYSLNAGTLNWDSSVGWYVGTYILQKYTDSIFRADVGSVLLQNPFSTVHYVTSQKTTT
jgi:hypothetical protein